MLRVPGEPLEFLGYRIGRNYRPRTGAPYVGTRPSQAYRTVDEHAIRRLLQWLCREHQVRVGKHVHFSDGRLWDAYGLARLSPQTASLSWAKA